MQKILSIVGPTATGKTELALQLTKLIPKLQKVDLVSADSRQVYKKMEIGTGADIPKTFEVQNDPHFSYPFHQDQNIRFHGISIIEPNQDWSLAHFCQFAERIFKQAEQDQSLPVVVGGTGLYLHRLFSSDPQLYVQPDPAIRQQAPNLSLEQLQEWLQKMNPEKFQAMNDSDRQNPRRLVRSIELSQQGTRNIDAQKEASDNKEDKDNNSIPTEPIRCDHFTIGLIDSIENITARINDRIEERLTHGMIEEVTFLISHYSLEEWKLPAFSATGYPEVRDYIQEKISYPEMKQLWLRREVQYAKRQLTWWKKHGQVEWIDISESEWSVRAIEKIKNWLFSL
jgi:tRNA dimethylallyltransferase